jgi:DNA-binding NtrC family response regulator
MSSDQPLFGTTKKSTPLNWRGTRVQVPALTIACHPNLHRVGEIAVLKDLVVGGNAGLSRAAPLFSHLGPEGLAEEGQALSDPYISRRPIDLQVTGDGQIALNIPDGVELGVDGKRVEGEVSVSAQQIDHGTLLTFADRVALVLHWIEFPVKRDDDLGLVGSSDAIEAVRVSIREVATHQGPVLLRGETGTGKELVARALARLGSRGKGPFIAVNVASISESVAASELFGHAKGAFTDANAKRDGYFIAADKGTLFLDEIGLMPVKAQPLLLRAIETGEIHPLGQTRPLRVDVRLISATDAVLENAIASAAFAEALFHRLATFEINLPPLRRRREDIGRLLVTFLRQELEQLDALDRMKPATSDGPAWLSAAVVTDLVLHPWPGNVRSLRNVAARLAMLGRRDNLVRLPPGVLPEAHRTATAEKAAASPDVTPKVADGSALRPASVTRALSDELDDHQRAAIVEALDQCGGNQTRAAAVLGMSRRSLCERLKRFNIPRPRVKQ